MTAAGTAQRPRPTGPAGTSPSGPAGRRPGGPARRPSAAGGRLGLVAGFVTLYLEVESARRPHRHLLPFLTPRLAARLAASPLEATSAATLVRVHAGPAVAGRYEAVAVVRRGRRCTALAVSLQRTAAGWRVDDLVRPERGVLPAAPYPLPPDDDDGPLDAIVAAAGVVS